MVCIGATVISIIQLYGVQEATETILKDPSLASALKVDIGRLGAQVVTGVGFLGAGTIIHEKGSVKGLTTAASIWVVACIGLAVGLGYYFLSIFATLAVFVVLVSLKQFEARYFHKSKITKLQVQYNNRSELVKKMEEYFTKRNIKVQNIDFDIEEDEETPYKTSHYTILIPRHISTSEVIRDLCYYEDIIKVTIV